MGVPRSGTTLLRLALDAHPQLALPPETGFLLPLFAGARWRLPRLTRQEFYRCVTEFHTWPDAQLDAEHFARALAELEPFTLAAGVRCFYRLYAAGQGKSRWGDKTPTYGAVLGRLRRLLPEARFVHLLRDGRDVALSLGKVWFAPGRDVASWAQHWARQIEDIRRQGRGDAGYLEVCYEDLVLAPRATLERVAGFLGLPYDEAMECYHLTARERLGEVRDLRRADGTVVTRAQRLGQHRLTSSPPLAERVGAWRQAMTSADVATFERVAGETLERFGYELSCRSPR